MVTISDLYIDFFLYIKFCEGNTIRQARWTVRQMVDHNMCNVSADYCFLSAVCFSENISQEAFFII